jgi:hypothetical protein
VIISRGRAPRGTLLQAATFLLTPQAPPILCQRFRKDFAFFSSSHRFSYGAPSGPDFSDSVNGSWSHRKLVAALQRPPLGALPESENRAVRRQRSAVSSRCPARPGKAVPHQGVFSLTMYSIVTLSGDSFRDGGEGINLAVRVPDRLIGSTLTFSVYTA